jgi:hypothetical protein
MVDSWRMAYPSRRTLLKLTVGAIASVRGMEAAPVPLFDGKTLDGWLQIENNATAFSSGGITDPAAFAAKLTKAADPVSAFLRQRLQPSLRAELAGYSAQSANAKAAIPALVKDLNRVVAGPSIYRPARFRGVVLRPETADLVHGDPSGQELARLNKLLIEDAYPDELAKSGTTGWTVKDGVMASTGSGRGVIYTEKDYTHFRLMFTMRHVSGNPDHQACVLIFCHRPEPGEKPLDALGGIQFQVPNGGHWDYRTGMNNNGGLEFSTVNKTHFDPHQWSRVEILADASRGTASMAVAQPPGSKAVEVLSFIDPAAGRTGPIAFQMHNAGLFDEYKDVTIDVDPRVDRLITVE